MTDLIILFLGLMSHVAGDGDRAAVLLNAPGHYPELRIAQNHLRTAIPEALGAVLEDDSYVIPLAGFRITTNLGFTAPRLDASVVESVPSLTSISTCRYLKPQVIAREHDEGVAAYFVYRGGALSVSSYESSQGRFDVWPEERCMPRSLEYRVPGAMNVELIFTRLSDNVTWTFGVAAGAQLIVSNQAAGEGHFHHQYQIFSNCTGPSPAAGSGCPRGTNVARRVGRISVQNFSVGCTPTVYP
jgi:hypothetical protein